MKSSDKSRLLKQCVESHAQLHKFIDSLSESQWTIPADDAGWTVKDHVAHIAAWMNGIVALLERKLRWSAMGLPASAANIGNVDEINELVRAKYSSLTTARVVAMLDEAYKKYIAVVRKTTLVDLSKPYAYYAKIRKPSEPESEAICGWVEGNSWQHIEEHMPWMRQIVIDDRAANLTLYGAGFGLLEAALAETPQEMWKFRPAEGAWSVHEIIIHLADSELNSYARVRKALVEPGSTIFGYDQDMWATVLDYHRRNTTDALELLRLVRKMTHELLAGQLQEIWSHSYFHPEMKRQVTLDAWLGIYSGHIPSHIAQIRGNVEAWRATQSSS